MAKISRTGGATDAVTGQGFPDGEPPDLTGDPEQADETSDPALANQEQEGGEQFDPADHTVSEVNEYLSTADDREARRVVAAERAGRNRSGVRAE